MENTEASANPTGETISFPQDDVNKAFEASSMGFLLSGAESANLPGFHKLDDCGDVEEMSKGRIPSLFLITRMSDGKRFAAEYEQSADEKSFDEHPFYSPDGIITFREVEQRKRTIIKEYYAFI